MSVEIKNMDTGRVMKRYDGWIPKIIGPDDVVAVHFDTKEKSCAVALRLGLLDEIEWMSCSPMNLINPDSFRCCIWEEFACVYIDVEIWTDHSVDSMLSKWFDRLSKWMKVSPRVDENLHLLALQAWSPKLPGDNPRS
jgi:hypothetical protein